MRLIARFPDKTQVGSLVDSLRNGGFDRKDMIISDLEDHEKWDMKEALEEVILIKTEQESLTSAAPYAEGIKELRGKKGIIVAVETPKHESDRVRAMMEQAGAMEIIQD